MGKESGHGREGLGTYSPKYRGRGQCGEGKHGSMAESMKRKWSSRENKRSDEDGWSGRGKGSMSAEQQSVVRKRKKG